MNTTLIEFYLVKMQCNYSVVANKVQYLHCKVITALEISFHIQRSNFASLYFFIQKTIGDLLRNSDHGSFYVGNVQISFANSYELPNLSG